MKQVTGKEFSKVLHSKGWELKRKKGSHHIFLQDGHRERIVVPVHGNSPLKIGLLKSLMKIANIEEKDL